MRGLLFVAGAACTAAAVAGCAGGNAHAGAKPGATCGTTRTAVNVPVVIKVAKGTVDCAVAMRVEAGDAARVKAGQVPGNGGGAPVTVDGWSCQAYSTPEVLDTGAASQCHTGSAQILAVLDLPSPGGTVTPGAS